MSDLLFALRTKQRVNTPMAPELGLFLCECQYDAYNKRFSTERVPLRLDNCGDKGRERSNNKLCINTYHDREYVIKDNMGEWIHKFISDKDGFRAIRLSYAPSVVEGGKIGAFKREEFPEQQHE